MPHTAAGGTGRAKKHGGGRCCKGKGGKGWKKKPAKTGRRVGEGGKRRAEKPDGAGVAEGGKAGGRPKAGDPKPESRENTVTMTVLPTYPPQD